MVNYFDKSQIMEELAFAESKRHRKSAVKSDKNFIIRTWMSVANKTSRIATTPLNLPNWSILRSQRKVTDQEMIEVK
jgi:hypothetical protein